MLNAKWLNGVVCCCLLLSLTACLHSEDTTITVVEEAEPAPQENDDPVDDPNTGDDDQVATDRYGQNTLNATSPLAVNIAPFAAWTPGWVLIDGFAKTQPWVSNLCNGDVWGSGPALNLDDNGWVAALPITNVPTP